MPTAIRGRAFLAVPLVLVNSAAVWGQAGWAFDNITSGGFWGMVIAVLFALAVESIGVYLAWESHESLMADQASGLLRLGSYGVGLLAGILNFLHFSAHSAATGVAFGALSAISPWLWAIWSRARNRARLADLGLVDTRGVKLSTVRKVWHPIKSLQVVSWAAWAGETDPAAAVAGWETHRVREVHPDPASQGLPDALESVETLETPQERRDRIKALRAAEPSLSADEIGRQVGVSGRRVRQVLAS